MQWKCSTVIYNNLENIVKTPKPFIFLLFEIQQDQSDTELDWPHYI